MAWPMQIQKTMETQNYRSWENRRDSQHRDINIGIFEIDRKKIADGLSIVLADSYLLYLKTQNFHWNVTDPLFSSLHQLFDSQYHELAEAVDVIAESIRSLGFAAPATVQDFVKRSSIKESIGVPIAQDMVKQLIEGHETVINSARDVFVHAERAKDIGTSDLIAQRIRHHEKAAWMLRSILE